MQIDHSISNRRQFIKSSALVATGASAFSLMPALAFSREFADEGINLIGPKEGFSPQIGTLVSMMAWMRMVVLKSVEKLTQPDLDVLFDANSNTIGALLMHLAASEAFYQENTFRGLSGPKLPPEFYKKWGAASNLGPAARDKIKGNDLKYYVDIMTEVREATLAEFKKRDDAWLMQVDPKFFDGKPTNNYCKWFHVCEHESNHNGQIKWYVKRLPGNKGGGD